MEDVRSGAQTTSAPTKSLQCKQGMREAHVWGNFRCFLQGNGHERDKLHFKDDDFYIFDMYNCQLWPADRLAKTAINCDKPIASGTGDGKYLARLEGGLTTSFTEFKPDIVLYNAGTDILDGDPLGA